MIYGKRQDGVSIWILRQVFVCVQICGLLSVWALETSYSLKAIGRDLNAFAGRPGASSQDLLFKPGLIV